MAQKRKLTKPDNLSRELAQKKKITATKNMLQKLDLNDVEKVNDTIAIVTDMFPDIYDLLTPNEVLNAIGIDIQQICPSCNNCNSCQNCYTCQTCNSCDTACQTCNTCQHEIAGDMISLYAREDLIRDQLINIIKYFSLYR